MENKGNRTGANEKETTMRDLLEQKIRMRATRLNIFLDARDLTDAVEVAIDMMNWGRGLNMAVYLTVEDLR